MDFIRAWEHPYVQFCGKLTVPWGCRADLGIPVPYDQWCRVLRGLVRPASARSSYIYQAKHDYATFDPLWPTRLLIGHELVGSQCLEYVHAQSSAARYTAPAQINSSKHRADSHSTMGNTAPYGSKNPRKIVQNRSAVIHSV